MSDAPPKTLSSRFQTLSHSCSRRNRPEDAKTCDRERLPAPATPAAAENRSFPPPRAEQAVQNRSIGTLAERAQARYRPLVPQCTNSAQTRGFSCTISSGPAAAIAACRSHFSSPTFRRTPERFCACAPAWIWRPTSSSPPAFRCRTGCSAGPAWTISTMSRSSATTPGRNSRNGARQAGYRLLLFTTKATSSYLDHRYDRGRHPAVRARNRGRSRGGHGRGRRAAR